ncbi:toprim domain-containing protein [Candidatus Woesearchaeota archaeon]|nr:toprim domain-containing protein [Candidatus Woesearchaeota archaeon]
MDRMESLEDWLAALQSAGCPIVVEGPKDRAALEQFGILDVVTLSREPLHEVVEGISARSKRVVILTDLDKEGKLLYSKLRQGFSRLGVQVDNVFREFLFSTQLSHIEGLATYIRRER